MRSILALTIVALAGCAPDVVIVDLNYPSQETFLRSEFARVFLYDLTESTDELGQCPALLRGTLAGTSTADAVLATASASVCQFRNGGVVFRDIPPGPHAWVSVVTNEGSMPILAGCTVAELYPDAPEIEISLFMTNQYRMAATEPLRCTSLADKCERGCP